MQQRHLPLAFFPFLTIAVLGCSDPTLTDAPSGMADSPDVRRSQNRSRLLSTFDNNAEGWTVVGDAVGASIESGILDVHAQFSSNEGNPGGAVFAVDEARGLTFFFQAPPRFLGNQVRYYGGTLEYDVKFSGPGDVGGNFDVVLAGDGLTLVVDAGPDPTTTWSSYRVVLDETAGWRIGHPVTGPLATRADIRSVLRNLTVLRIRGEYTNHVDTGYLDNVRVVRKRH